jgi:hypothetical protein
MSWLERLERELTARGVPRRMRQRILLELDDHLQCDPEATERLGDPVELAWMFADELAASTSRRAALGSFALLVPVGIAMSACLLAAATFTGPDITAAETLPLGLAAALGMVLAPQVALAAGLLALLGWLRTCGLREIPASEAALLCRRAVVGLLSGAAALVSLALYAFEYRAALPAWWMATSLAVSLALVIPVLVAAARVRHVAHIRSRVGGAPGDVFDDLRIPSLRRPWLLCAMVATAAALAVGVAGGADDGVRNAVVEATAVIGGFAVLGRRLGLRADD